MKRKNKTGISMIVLVITIIIMIILAASVVITLNNTGIIRQSNVAVDKSELKEVEHAVALAWAEAYMEGNRTPEALREAMETKLEGTDLSNYEYEPTDKGVTVTQVVKREKDDKKPLPKLNEYGFYYEIAYELPLYLGGFGPGALVFHEDGSAEAYMAVGGVNWGLETCNITYPAGAVKYENGKITFPNSYFVSAPLEVKDNGMRLVEGKAEVYECTGTYPGELRFNKPYVGLEWASSKPMIVTFKDESTIEFVYYESEDATEPTTREVKVNMTGKNHMMKVIGETYKGIENYGSMIGSSSASAWMDHAYAYVTLDGKQVIISGSTALPFGGIVELVEETVID